MTTAEILESASHMRADEQLFLIESLVATLDVTDPSIDAASVVQAQDRLSVYKSRQVLLAECGANGG